MIIVTETINHQLGTTLINGCGFLYSTDKFYTTSSISVTEAVCDDSGKTDIEALLTELAGNDFQKRI